MAGGNLKSDVRAAMSGVGLTLDADVLSKCMGLCTSLHVEPSRLAELWEAHSLNADVDVLNDVTFAAYRNALLKDVEARAPTTSGGGGGVAVVKREGLGKRSAAMITPPPPDKGGMRDGGGSGGRTNVSAVDAVVADSSPSKKASASGPAASANVVTPAALKRKAVSIQTPKYDDRTGAGQTVVSYNPRDWTARAGGASSTGAGRRSCVVRLLADDGAPHPTGPYRYMFTPIEDRARALDDRIVEMGRAMIERYDIPSSDVDGVDDGGGMDVDDGKEEDGIATLGPVGVPRQEAVCCVGRVCNEAHEGRINRTSVVLEGSRHYSGGSRINLDVSNLTDGGKSSSGAAAAAAPQSYSLFPGQIVAVEGINASGRKMVAQRICEGAAPLPVKTHADQLLTYHHGSDHQDGKPLSIMSMCGPYTTSDNLDYDPFQDALEIVRDERPDVVVMAGPFVDARQPLVASGDLSLSLEDGGSTKVNYELLFAHKVAAILEQLFEEEGGDDLPTQFVLVPSLDDAVAEPVYPQPPLADRVPNGRTVKLSGAEGIELGSLGLKYVEAAGRGADGNHAKDRPKRVHCVPNPCTLRINELTIGVTSTDVLLHIGSDETNANLEPGSRLSRLAQHLLQQRSYYPLFPPPAAPATAATNLDLNHMDGWSMPCQPDILLVPSKLATFARRVLDGTVVVNPGMLSRGTTGGTYAMMDVHPMKRDALEEGSNADMEMDHAVPDRIRVDIKRI